MHPQSLSSSLSYRQPDPHLSLSPACTDSLGKGLEIIKKRLQILAICAIVSYIDTVNEESLSSSLSYRQPDPHLSLSPACT